MEELGAFYREDLSHPENRVNAALFGALGIEPFHQAFANALGLPPDSVIFPPQNTIGDGGSVRPDFRVLHGGSPEAWIEVELGSDSVQIARYRRELPERVIPLWGAPTGDGEPHLRDVGAMAERLASSVEPQQSVQLRHLAGVIAAALEGYRAQRRATVSDEMRESSFYARLDELLNGIRPVSSYNPSGYVYADTVGEAGFSIRVASPVSKTNGATVSILNRSAGRPYIEVSGLSHLRKYLPSRTAEVDAFANLVSTLGADLDGRSRTQRRVNLATAEANAGAIAAALEKLA